MLLAAQVLRRLRQEVVSSEWELVRRTIDTAKEMVSTNAKQREEGSSRRKRKQGKQLLSQQHKHHSHRSRNGNGRRRDSLEDADGIHSSLRQHVNDTNNSNNTNGINEISKEEEEEDAPSIGHLLKSRDRRGSVEGLVAEVEARRSMVDWALGMFAKEITTVGAESNDRTIIAELNRGLLEGRPTGSTGNLEITSISTTWLEKSIQTALELVPQTERARSLLGKLGSK